MVHVQDDAFRFGYNFVQIPDFVYYYLLGHYLTVLPQGQNNSYPRNEIDEMFIGFGLVR